MKISMPLRKQPPPKKSVHKTAAIAVVPAAVAGVGTAAWAVLRRRPRLTLQEKSAEDARRRYAEAHPPGGEVPTA